MGCLLPKFLPISHYFTLSRAHYLPCSSALRPLASFEWVAWDSNPELIG